jgi:hypothetical protein
MASSFTYPSAPTNETIACPGNRPAVNAFFEMGNLLQIAPIIIAANTAPATAPEQSQEMRRNAEEIRQEREGTRVK